MRRVHSGLMLGIAFSFDSLKVHRSTTWKTETGRIRDEGSEAMFCDMTGQPYSPVASSEWNESILELANQLETDPTIMVTDMLDECDRATEDDLDTRPIRIMPGVARGGLVHGTPEPEDRAVIGIVVARLDDFDADFSEACRGLDLNDLAGRCSEIALVARSMGIEGTVKLFPWLYMDMDGVEVLGVSQMNSSEHSENNEDEVDDHDELRGPHERCKDCPSELRSTCSQMFNWNNAQ
jgi:hypothetical protein